MLYSLKGKSPKIHKSCFIAPNAVLIGDIQIGPNASVWFNCTLRADKGIIKIDQGAVIEENCVIHGISDTFIGKNTVIGHNTVIHSSIIEDSVLIGANCILMDGVKVREGSMIEMKSQLQPHVEIPPFQYIRGKPISKKGYKKIRKIKDDTLERNAKYVRAYGEIAQFYKNNLKIKEK